MTHQERKDKRERIADKLTDDCPLEALLQHFYIDQLEWVSDLSDEDLLEKEKEIFK
jgi:hypothetical protein